MTAFALAGALNWIAHWYRENQSMTAGEIAEAFVRIFNLGLAPRTELAPPAELAQPPASAAARPRARPSRTPRGTPPLRSKS